VSVFAFRNSLGWILGSNGNLAGIPQLFLLLFIFATPLFVAAIRRGDSPAEAQP
jgi:hypothetical protein